MPQVIGSGNFKMAATEPVIHLSLVSRLVNEMKVPGRRKVGRPRKSWKVTVKRDFEVFGVNENVAFDR